MSLNKIQQRALVFKIIEPLREMGAIDDYCVKNVLNSIRKIEDLDFDFISKLLVKEADYRNPKTAGVFIYIAQNLSPDAFLGLLMNELNSNMVSDNQKMFYMNILSGIGVPIGPDAIEAYLSNPDEAVNMEASRFLDAALVNPEVQIDFMDFYTSSSNEEKTRLLDSITGDFDGDNLANILSPLVLTSDDEACVSYCLDLIEKSKSLIGIKPMKYLTFFQDEKISSRAKKFLRKMSMTGIYTKEKSDEFFLDIMKDYLPPQSYFSFPDGNSNFSVVVVRKNQNGAYSISFNAVNAELGPFSSFGFASLTKADCENTLKRFFAHITKIPVSPLFAKKILYELTCKRISQNKAVPYEYYCWEKLLDDIPLMDVDLEKILTGGLTKIPIGIEEKKTLYNSPFMDRWFFRYSKNNPVISSFLDKIMGLDPHNISKMDDIVDEYSTNPIIQKNLETRLKFLSFCFKMANAVIFGNVFISFIYDKKEFKNFVSLILKKTVYEHVLNLKMPFKSKNIFDKPEFARNPESVKPFIDYIESNWTEG